MEQFIADNIWLIALIVAWVLPWKGVALWMAARRNHIWWFIVFLVINSFAILPIIYIFLVARRIEVSAEEDGGKLDSKLEK